eukprot:ANDGO_06126.mRNA.1 AUGMIN subunit 5
MASAPKSSANVPLHEAVVDWLSRMKYNPRGPYIGTRPPSAVEIRDICRGNMIPILQFLTSHIKPKEDALLIRANVYANRQVSLGEATNENESAIADVRDRCARIEAEMATLRLELVNVSRLVRKEEDKVEILTKSIAEIATLVKAEELRFQYLCEFETRLKSTEDRMAVNSVDGRKRSGSKVLAPDGTLESVAERAMKRCIEDESQRAVVPLVLDPSREVEHVFRELSESREALFLRFSESVSSNKLTFGEVLDAYKSISSAVDRKLDEDWNRGDLTVDNGVIGAVGDIGAPGAVESVDDALRTEGIDDLLHDQRNDHFKRFIANEQLRTSAKNKSVVDPAQVEAIVRSTVEDELAALETECLALEAMRQNIEKERAKIDETETYRVTLLDRFQMLVSKNAQLATRLVPLVQENLAYLEGAIPLDLMKTVDHALATLESGTSALVDGTAQQRARLAADADALYAVRSGSSMTVSSSSSSSSSSSCASAAELHERISQFLGPACDLAESEVLARVSRMRQEWAAFSLQMQSTQDALARTEDSIDFGAGERHEAQVGDVQRDLESSLLEILEETVSRLSAAADQSSLMDEIRTERECLQAQNAVPWKSVDGLDVQAWKREIKSLLVQLDQKS